MSIRHRRPLALLAGFCVFIAAVYATGEWYRRIDYREKFVAMRGKLASVETSPAELRGGHSILSVSLQNDRNILLSASLRVPDGKGKRYPAIVILGGVVTGRRTIDYLDSTDDIVLLALDYPYEGKREKLGVLEFAKSLPRIRRAVLETVPAIMLGIDYLLTRDDVMPDRIILVGGSLGAMFVPAAMASDGRIAAGAILFGAGNIELLLRSDLDLPAPVGVPVSWACAVLTSPVEPLKYVADISPRPLFMLNGSRDPRINPECSRILHETARDPKTIVWLDAGHLGVSSRKFHELQSLAESLS